MSEPSFIEGVDVDAFVDFEEDGYSDEDALELAQGLLEDALPCLREKYSTLNSAQKKVAKFAVLEMAKFLKEDFKNFNRATSPFQSESLGAYSYSKMVRSVQSQTATGIPAFDRAVEMLGPLCAEGSEGGSYSSSEQVFKPGYSNFITNRELGQQQFIPPGGSFPGWWR